MPLFTKQICRATCVSIFCHDEKEFLLLDEFVKNEYGGGIKRTDCTVIADGVTAKWPASANEGANALTNVSFTLQSGQTMAIVGQVGSGKV